MTTAPTDIPIAIRRVRARLRRLRRAGRALLATRVVSVLCVWGMLLVAALVLADLLLRFPGMLRGVLLALLMATSLWAVRRRLLPITRFKPALSDVALRVEGWIDRRGAAPPGPIASGIDVPIDDPDPVTRRLSRLVAEQAAGRFTRTPWGLLRWIPAARSLVILIIVAAGLAAVFNARPTLAVTGLTRLFMPWTDTPWPKRTEIADTTSTDAHPADIGLPLRAILLRTNKSPGESSITVEYRVIDSQGNTGPLLHAVLTPQPTKASQTRPGGELFEKLVEPTTWKGSAGNECWLEYTLFSEDDTTATKRIRIVEPPELVQCTISLTPPAYAQGVRNLSADERIETIPAPPAGEAIEIGPVLPGSTLTVDLAYNKPVTPVPDTTSAGHIDARFAANGSSVHVEIDPTKTGQITLGATDTLGLKTRRDTALQINVTPDAPPEATILSPEVDDVVLPTATLSLLGEGRDDIALTRLSLEYLIARPDPSSSSQEPAADPEAEPVVLTSIDPALVQLAEVKASLVVAELDVKPGDEIRLRAVATDNFDLENRRHEPVYSSPRRLRVIAQAEFIELLQAELEGVRRTAIRLDRQQAELIEQTRKAGKAESDDRNDQLETLTPRQTGLSQRLQAQAAMLNRFIARTEQNGLTDEAIRDLLENALRTTDRAARASRQAAEQLARLSHIPEAGTESAAQPQAKVRDELARLIEQLDRGHDGWQVRKNIEQLLSQEQALHKRTEEIARQTVGRTLDELHPDERTELERIAQRQQELAARARDAIDQLGKRADEIRKKDAAQAAAMDQAAREAMQKQMAELLGQAAERIGQNQTTSGRQLQQQSIEAMQQMLEQLENAHRHRDEALRRQLAGIMQAIESLIRQQQTAIAALDDEPAEASNLARRVHTNTIATEADTREGFSELIHVADLLNRAADFQADAISSLRRLVPEIGDAREHQTESLARLHEALEEAKKQDDNARRREQQRKRRELRQAYKDVLTEQLSLREQAGAFVGREMTRRQRAKLRDIGRQQEALRTVIEAIPEEHETDDVGILSLYHDRIDLSLTEAVRAMGRGRCDADVTANQNAAIVLLGSIIDTLAPQQNEPNDEFENSQAGGGGGGGQAGEDAPNIGNVEQLKLLRSLQAIVLDQTRSGKTAGLAELQRELAQQARELIEQMGRPPSPDTHRPTDPGGDK